MYESNAAFVAHISLVKGIPFYGYHVGYKHFLKIYLLNPSHINRLADLLRQGAVMKQAIQPYESHMQYILQWMCDYNLYGCAYIDCRRASFRSPVPDYFELDNPKHHWNNHTIPESFIVDPTKFLRQSHCSIEVDICAHDILNRVQIKARPIHHEYIETGLNSPDEKLVHSMAGLWRDEKRRRKARMTSPSSKESVFGSEDLISISADPRNAQPGGWIHEEEYLEQMLAVIGEERLHEDRRKTFENLMGADLFQGQVRTTFESIEDLFPTNLSKLEPLDDEVKGSQLSLQELAHRDIEIDESRILSIELDDTAYASDEEAGDHLPEVEQEPAAQEINLDAQKDAAVHQKKPSASRHLAEPIDETSQSVGELRASDVRTFGVSSLSRSRKARSERMNEEEAFEVPDDYSSNLVSAMAHRERTGARIVAQDRPKKRLKLTHAALGSAPTVVNHPQIIKPGISVDEHTEDCHDRNNDDYRVDSFENKVTNNPGHKDPQNLETAQTSSHLPQSSNGHHKPSRNEKGVIQTPQSTKIEERKPEQDVSPTANGKVPHAAQNYVSPWTLSKRLSGQRQVISLFITKAPPSQVDELRDPQGRKLPTVIYQDAYYSDERDVPSRPREYAGKDFRLASTTVPYLPEFDPTGRSIGPAEEHPKTTFDMALEEREYQKSQRACTIRTWEFAELPPGRSQVQQWLRNNQEHQGRQGARSMDQLSQLEGPSQRNKHGFKYSQKQASTNVQHEAQYMSLMSLEVHVNTRGTKMPDPEQDEISCIIWCLRADDESFTVDGLSQGMRIGVLALSEEGTVARAITGQASVEVEEEPSELDLINRLVDIVRSCDPDILTGYEVHGGSWGYIIERARHKYDYNLCDELSRMKSQSHGRFGRENDKWGFNQTSTIRITGRHMINIWRAMRGELNLSQYTLENVAFHLLHRRVPHYPYSDLTRWYSSNKPKDMHRVVSYFINRVQINLDILEQNELIPRISEQARLLGVDFFSVISRGSQFKVESLMFRIAKPESFILISPSRKQVGQQNALECLPLVMEPQSDFYTSPVLVLDFQSLYPSVMIAYNYCYSTFLGRVANWRGRNKMGFTDYEREPGILELLKNQMNVAPNGMLYVKPHVRKSLLAKMLGEILETRVMVKGGMKVDRADKTLQQLLNNRQLALKLIANVTYGYTSASFSGRMPCSEIADSIVQTGRETLEKAIAVIHSVDRWNAEVVYGDTDSLFVHLKGRSKDEAFEIGNEIAKTITEMNPRPIKLKFEKVYLPSILLAKKRYVGFRYENKTAVEPDFDAKGIETIRRDGTVAQQKIEEKALKILFRTADLSQVKKYFQRQCTKLMRGRVSIQDFFFAKEVKLGTYSDRGPPPPGALVSTRRMLQDHRAEPQYGERVPYVVITGAPGSRLIDRCVAPNVLIQNDSIELDAAYYISKNLIPPLERIFNLVGANVRQWYDEMPKVQRIRPAEWSNLLEDQDLGRAMKTLESYMKSSACIICGRKREDEDPLCGECLQDPETSLMNLHVALRNAETKSMNLNRICRSCAGLPWGFDIGCDSMDCPVFFTRTRHQSVLDRTRVITQPIMRALEDSAGKPLDW
jgi:DNA polymerase zeta